MNAKVHTRRPAPPKPPLAIRLEKLRVFLAYTSRHNWKIRTIAIIVLVLTLTTAWWVHYVRLPLLAEQRASIIDPVALTQEIKTLQTEYQLLSTQESLHSLDMVNQRILDGYADISQLLEAAQSRAKRNQLMLSYSLEEPVPANFTYFQNVFIIKLKVNLMPYPKTPSHKVWSNVIQQVQYMVEDSHFFHLLSSHATGNNKKIETIELGLHIYARLPHHVMGAL